MGGAVSDLRRRRSVQRSSREAGACADSLSAWVRFPKRRGGGIPIQRRDRGPVARTDTSRIPASGSEAFPRARGGKGHRGAVGARCERGSDASGPDTFASDSRGHPPGIRSPQSQRPSDGSGAKMCPFASPRARWGAPLSASRAVARSSAFSWRRWTGARGGSIGRWRRCIGTKSGAVFEIGPILGVPALAVRIVEGEASALAAALAWPRQLIRATGGTSGFRIEALEGLPGGLAAILDGDGDPAGETCGGGTGARPAGRRTEGGGDVPEWYARHRRGGRTGGVHSGSNRNHGGEVTGWHRALPWLKGETQCS